MSSRGKWGFEVNFMPLRGIRVVGVNVCLEQVMCHHGDSRLWGRFMCLCMVHE